MAIQFYAYATESHTTLTVVFSTIDKAADALVDHLSLGSSPSQAIFNLAHEAKTNPCKYIQNGRYGEVIIYPVELL